MSTRHDSITEATIRCLIDAFYARVRNDPALGPVFANAIADAAWPGHLQKMYAFWSSVMLTSGHYKGNPVAVHHHVAGIAPPLFGNWLDLFEEVATEIFVPDISNRFLQATRRIAESLKLALFFRPDQPWPDDLRQRPGGSASCA